MNFFKRRQVPFCIFMITGIRPGGRGRMRRGPVTAAGEGTAGVVVVVAAAVIGLSYVRTRDVDYVRIRIMRFC